MSDRDRDYWTVHEAADYLRTSIWGVYRLTNSGRLPSYKMPGSRRLLFRPDDVMLAVVVRTPVPTAPCREEVPA